jgi:hypothetical protein
MSTSLAPFENFDDLFRAFDRALAPSRSYLTYCQLCDNATPTVYADVHIPWPSNEYVKEKGFSEIPLCMGCRRFESYIPEYEKYLETKGWIVVKE